MYGSSTFNFSRDLQTVFRSRRTSFPSYQQCMRWASPSLHMLFLSSRVCEECCEILIWALQLEGTYMMPVWRSLYDDGLCFYII